VSDTDTVIDLIGRRVITWRGRLGAVTGVNPYADQKPLIVRHDDGTTGYYHTDQISAVRPAYHPAALERLAFALELRNG
jgi:hypothetical protein